MFDIGFWELVLIFVIALVVLGPERMPAALRSVGRFVKTARQMANSVKDELNRELELSQIQKDIQKTEQTIKKQISDVQSSVDEAVHGRDAVADPESPSSTGQNTERLSVTSTTEQKPESQDKYSK